jgi:uncharacterized protein with ParB-like and HNH nuclease domain
MEAKARAFTFLDQEQRIKVPFFQRKYVWKEENWKDLLAELSNTNRTHFLGSIILKQQVPITGEPKEALIIDGQQRLTTLSVLLKALFDTFPADQKANCLSDIRQYLFYKKNKTDKSHLIKINHSQVDAKAFTQVMQAELDGKPPVGEVTESDGKILQCYSFFFKQLSARDFAVNEAMYNWLLNNQNEILVVIDLKVDDDEQAIFDTINSAGVRLSAADIIKNALFQKVIEFEGEVEATIFHNETWGEVISEDLENSKFWEKQFVTGRLKRDNIEILLHSIAVIKGFYDPDIDTLADLSKLYKKKIASFNTKDELRAFINDIKDYAVIYKTKIPVFKKETMFSYEDFEQRLFHILDRFEITTFHPFILSVYKQCADDANRLLSIFSVLESFVIRRVLSKYEVKSFNKFCKEFIDNPSALYTRLSQTGDGGFVGQLKAISNRHAALLLFWIELYRRANNKKVDLKHLKYSYSLEHIMPQSWQEHWKTFPVKTNADNSIMTTEQSKNDRKEKIYWIGNMTLLNTSLNSSLKNFKFTTKVEGEGRNKGKGIRAYADLLITKADILEPFDAGDHEWDEKKIVARTEQLINEINTIWKKEVIASAIA